MSIDVHCLNKKCAFNKRNRCARNKTIKLSEVGICLSFIKTPKYYKSHTDNKCMNCVNEGCDNCSFMVLE